MQELGTYVVAFAAGLGALIGGGHLAIVFGTVALGILIVLSLIGAYIIAKQRQEAAAQVADFVASGGGDQWTGVPPDAQSGIVPAPPEDPFDPTA